MTCPDFQTCPHAENWNLLSMNLVEDEEAARLREHLDECERCQAVWQEASSLHEELQGAFAAFDRDHDQLREQLLARLSEETSANQPDQRKGTLAMILHRHSTRWAVATTLAAASILMVVLMLTSGRVVFADVLENMRQAKTMVCDVMTKTIGSKPAQGLAMPGLEEQLRGKMSMYLEGDTRAVLNEMKFPPAFAAQPGADTTMRTLYRGGKAYLWMNGKLQVLDSLNSIQQMSADEWLTALLHVQDAPDRQLGEKMINGRRATGFEIAGWKLRFGTKPTEGNATPSDSKSVVRVWVDVERDLPTRIEVEQELSTPAIEGTVHGVYDNIQWNVPLDPADFQPPSEEELAKATNINVPTVGESTFIDFLKVWLDAGKQAQAGIEILKQRAQEKGEALPFRVADFVKGQSLSGYPEKLDTNWLSGAFVSRQTVARTAEAVAKQAQQLKDVSPEERQKLVVESAMEAAKASVSIMQDAMLQAMSAAMFYQRLANEGHEPEYFGATVKPGDGAAVLLRWKLDDGKTRVIHGDLRVETVDDAK